jgi:hypothetical protein
LSESAPAAPTDVARLSSLLRERRSPICATCAARKLGFDLPRMLEAAAGLARTVALEQYVAACSVCGRSQWIMLLRL